MVTLLRSPFLVLAILLIPCLSEFLPVHGETRRPKNVQVAVRAKWEGTPILLEAGELLAKDWKDLYWEFVKAWLQDGRFDGDESYTAKDCLKIIAEHGQSFMDGPLARLFEFSLTLRSASPRLVLFRQLAEQSLSSFPLYVDETPETSNGAKRLDTLTVGVNPEVPGGECCWVDTGGALFLNVAELLMWLQGNAGAAGDSFQPPELFDFDHIYPHWQVGSPVAILYGALGTDCFKEFHVTLVKAAKEGRVKYVVRPVLPSGCETKAGYCGAVGATDSLKLGGYGVELALKNMEYKAMDDSAVKKGITLEDPRTEDLSQEIRGFIFSKILERKPELISEIMAFRDNLLSSTISDTLDIWELKGKHSAIIPIGSKDYLPVLLMVCSTDLGHQTAQRIVHASDPLQSMQDISQNFPGMVSSLSRMKLDDSVKDEITANQRMIPPGKSLMAMNGALINIDDVDLYLMVDWLQQELLLADQFSKLKVPHSTIRKLLSTLSPPESTMFRVDFRSEHVHYINNIEEDAMYKRWRSNINEILSPVFPGQLRYIRKNLFHTVYVVDPASACGLESVDSLISYYENSFPMRFGLLLYSSKVAKKIELDGVDRLSFEKEAQAGEDISTLVIRLFIYIKETYGIQTAVRFLINLNRLRTESTDLVGDAPEMHNVEEAFVETLLPKVETHPQDVLLKLVKEGTFQELAHAGSLFVFKLGFPKSGCCILMNGLVLDSTEEALINAMNDELPRIQEQVYYGHINFRTDVLDKFLSESGISRYNPQIIEGKGKPRFVLLTPTVLDGEPFLKEISYLHSPGSEDDVKPVTHLLTVAITSKKGVKLLLEGIHYLIEGSKAARVGVLFSADQDPNLLNLLFLKAFDISVSLHSRRKNVLYFMEQLCLSYEQMHKLSSAPSTESTDAFIAKVYELASEYDLPSSVYKSSLTYSAAEEMRKDISKASQFLGGQLGIESGVNSIITNGRVTSLGEQGSILSHDLRLLEEVEYRQRVKHIVEVIEDVDWQEIDPDMITSKFVSDIIMYVSSAMSQRQRSSESARFEILNAEHSAVIVGNGNSSIHIDAVIDPLSPAGQKLAPLLLFFRKHIQPSMRIVLNPMSSLADLPLKNYYRYVFPTMDDFSSVDLTVNGPKAFFANMPLSKTLTMNLDVPEPWLIEPVIAVHDLDNILLENLGDTKTLIAVFELEALLLTGHCNEKDHDFPRGLQLILGTKSQPHLVDTLVMANLGYWQMKVFPGVLYLQLAPGRSSELYVLKEDADLSQINPQSKRIIINDLRGKVVHLEVVKKSGMEHEKLLLPTDENSHETKSSHDTWNSNIFKWASGFIGGGRQSNKNEKKLMNPGTGGRHGKTINIFSIASGHLYERFLKIMILSVLKNTNRPVKFWFIKNYLSPQFKDVIPLMARDYGFEYELITYKWPTWLHKQKEKQRIIWAYKILFLDVIFPLSLEKVIFVDADQVVRADMGELYDMDINGRPLAYTPFCDNNKDMDGYRFWRQGFWKEHLRGRPYHISALYVVDLVKFRETAAGDHLRIFYESLSKDPNSLSNLDQDLPNYAQHTVPIFSLPQEWLWCESWCGNATKSKAKTIDLCNNPMTKEPKLQGARRIVSEWVELDSEARTFTAKLWGDEVDDSEKPIASNTQSQISASAGLVDDDLETKAEL